MFSAGMIVAVKIVLLSARMMALAILTFQIFPSHVDLSDY